MEPEDNDSDLWKRMRGIGVTDPIGRGEDAESLNQRMRALGPPRPKHIAGDDELRRRLEALKPPAPEPIPEDELSSRLADLGVELGPSDDPGVEDDFAEKYLAGYVARDPVPEEAQADNLLRMAVEEVSMPVANRQRHALGRFPVLPADEDDEVQRIIGAAKDAVRLESVFGPSVPSDEEEKEEERERRERHSRRRRHQRNRRSRRRSYSSDEYSDSLSDSSEEDSDSPKTRGVFGFLGRRRRRY